MMKILTKSMILAILLCLINGKSMNINIKSSLTKPEIDERMAFFNRFIGHKSLRSYLKKTKNTVFLLSKYNEKLKLFWSEYVRFQRRMDRFSDSPAHSEIINVYSGNFFYGNVSVGTPSQTFSVEFEINFPYFFLPHPDCQVCGSSGISFNANQSSTWINKGYYDDHYSSGVDGTDTITVGDLTVTNFSMSLAISGVANVFNGPIVGSLGLGVDVGPTKLPGFLDLIKSQLQIKRQFSYSIDPSFTQSLLIFGEPNSSLYTGDLKYYSLKNALYYQIKFGGFSISNKSYKNGGTLSIDPNSIPIALSNQLYQQISPLFSSSGNFPDLIFVIDNDNYTIPGSALGTPGNLLIYPAGTGPNTIAGNIFVQFYYTYYDLENSRMGFAKSSKAPSN